MLTRRHLLHLSAGTVLLQHAAAAEDSRFGAATTAEEVTADLDLRGKTVLITGCNSGIGYEAMRVLVLRGAHVLGLARNMDKATEACASVSKDSGGGKATPFACEQSDFASVKACAQEIRKLGIPLDVVICNAGVAFLEKLTQTYGLEQHFVINHLSHFILVHHLLDQVKAARQGRVVVVGSVAYELAVKGIEFDNLSGDLAYDRFRMYGRSKLANGLFAFELARRIDKTSATANVLHPGTIETDIWRNFGEDRRHPHAGEMFGGALVKTTPQGAATTCYVATNPALNRVNGKYFADCHQAVPNGYMKDHEMAARLWDESVELTKSYL